MPDTLDIPVPGQAGTNPKETVMEQPNLTDAGNLTVALTGMANEFGAAAARRVNASDQLANDSQRMWSIAMTTPTVSSALGFQTASESGSGRARNIDNTNAAQQATGPAK